MKRNILIIVIILFLFELTACSRPKIIGYHINESGELIATYDDNTEKDLGLLTDTIPNGVASVTINEDGYYVINGIITKIKANIPENYEVNSNGDLIVTYVDGTKKNLGNFKTEVIKNIDNILISDEGYYILDGIQTEIVAIINYEVSFNTGYDVQLQTQVVEAGEKVECPQLNRVGYTLIGWYYNDYEWDFNTNVVLNDIILTAKWRANEITVNFNTKIDEHIQEQTVIFDNEYTLPVLERDGYNFIGWEYNGSPIDSEIWSIPNNCVLDAIWEQKNYNVEIDANGGFVSNTSMKVTYGEHFILPIATNEFGVFKGWFHGDVQLTDSQGKSLNEWNYLNDIEVTTSWIIDISTIDDLKQLHLYPNGHFQLMNDIDISFIEWIPIGDDDNPFTGQINGNNYSIIGLKIMNKLDDSQYYGLIGKSKNCKIFNLSLKNVTIEVPYVTNSVNIGALIAYSEESVIDNIFVSGIIKIIDHEIFYSSNVGGICGHVIDGTVKNCINTATIFSKTCAGGIIGLSENNINSTFFNNTNFGDIQSGDAGGLIGRGIDCSINSCDNSGKVIGVESAGGIIGECRMSVNVNSSSNKGLVQINYSYNSSENNTDASGGIVGAIYSNYTLTGKDAIISNCYNIGKVKSNVIAGGIVGSFQNGKTLKITNCYVNEQIEGRYYAGGIVGVATNLETTGCIYYGASINADFSSTIGKYRNYANIQNCYYSCNSSRIKLIQGTQIEHKFLKTFYTEVLLWDESIWEFYEDMLPTIKKINVD